MKLMRTLLVLLICSVILPMTAFAEFNFTTTINDLNVAARSNPSRFKIQTALEFGVSIGEVERLAVTLGSHADAYMSLKVEKLSGRGIEEVVQSRKSSPGAGWGKTAQMMGIKPGSDEFMQLKKSSMKQHKKSKKQKNRSQDKKNK